MPHFVTIYFNGATNRTVWGTFKEFENHFSSAFTMHHFCPHLLQTKKEIYTFLIKKIKILETKEKAPNLP